MTTLDHRAVRRETNTIDHTRGGRRLLIVKLEVGGKIVRMKPKGTRKWFSIDYSSIYRLAVMAHARQAMAERKAAKAERRKLARI